MTEDWGQRIGKSKAAIDYGFSRVGPSLRPEAVVDGALLRGAGSVVRLSNAVVLLCKHHHVAECGPLLRSMASIALAMRWIASADEKEYAAVASEEARDLNWERMTADPRWVERWRRAGLTDAERLALERGLAGPDGVVRPWAAPGMPWSHVFHGTEAIKESTSWEVLRWAAELMGYALKALDARWPGNFQLEENAP